MSSDFDLKIIDAIKSLEERVRKLELRGRALMDFDLYSGSTGMTRMISICAQDIAVVKTVRRSPPLCEIYLREGERFTVYGEREKIVKRIQEV